MKKIKSSFRYNRLLLIVVFVCLLIVVSFLLLREKQPVLVKTQLTPEATVSSGWKTYTNTYFGFQIKIPSDWDIIEKQGTPYFQLKSPDQSVAIQRTWENFPFSLSDNSPEKRLIIGRGYDETIYYYATMNNDTIYDIQIGNNPNGKDTKFTIWVKNVPYSQRKELIHNILQTFSFTVAKQPLITDIISYKVPTGWTTTFSEPGGIIYIEPTHQQLQEKAVHLNSPNSLSIQLRIYINNDHILYNSYAEIEHIGKMDFDYASAGYPGTYIGDSYSLYTKDYIVTITYYCGDLCQTNHKKQVQKDPLYSDVQFFLESITLN